MRKIALASASPRRRMLLESAGFDVELLAQNADETWPGGTPEEAVTAIALRKLAAAPKGGDRAVLAADTVVLLGWDTPRIIPLGKPRDIADARRILGMLSGVEHRVITGYCLRRGDQQRVGSVVSRVWFRALSSDEIERYIEREEPFDKAGAYGIQGMGGALIDHVEGSYTNIMGLPLRQVTEAWESLR